MTVVLLALGLAAQPWSVLAAIVLVATRGGVRKEIAYVVGWVGALTVVAALSAKFSADLPQGSSSTGFSVAEVVLGLAVGLILLVRWRRPSATAATSPSWMSRLDAMPWFLALVLGAFLPNYLFVVAAVTEMLQVGLTGASLVATVIIFIIIASMGVAAPLAVLVFRRHRAAEIYAGWRAWIIGHSRAVSYGTGAILAALLVVKGVVGIISAS